jgi:hypothetical protein
MGIVFNLVNSFVWFTLDPYHRVLIIPLKLSAVEVCVFCSSYRGCLPSFGVRILVDIFREKGRKVGGSDSESLMDRRIASFSLAGINIYAGHMRSNGNLVASV